MIFHIRCLYPKPFVQFQTFITFILIKLYVIKLIYRKEIIV